MSNSKGMVSLNLSKTVGEVSSQFTLTDNQIRKAVIKATNPTIDKLLFDITGAIARANKTPVTKYRKYRGRKIRMRQRKMKGRVWIGGNKIAAAYLGKIRQIKSGTHAGRHFFEGAFAQTMRSGYRSVWKRGKGDIELEQQFAKIGRIEEITEKFLARETPNLEASLRVQLIRQLRSNAGVK